MADTRTDGMIALIPDEVTAERIGTVGPQGEATDDLHLTLAYLGDDVMSLPEAQREAILEAARVRAMTLPPVTARVFAHAVFNPDAHADRQPCAVYLVSDSRELGPLREELGAYAAAEQHEPFIPHITAGYGVPVDDLTFTGPVRFDRLRVALGGDYHDFPLTGTSTKGSTVDETKGKVSQAERDRLAKGPRATGEGTYVIKDIGDLKNAISKYSKVSDPDEKAKLRKHIVSNAKRLKATNMLPKNWTETPAKEKKDGEYDWSDASDAFTAGVLLGLAGEDEPAELKAGPPGHTFPSKDPRAAQLREYWTRGPGAAKVRWGTGGDFDRCVRHLRKYVGTRAEGLCNIYHRSAVGAPPGKGHKSLSGEEKSLTLWMPDASSPAGYRAHRASWMHVTDPTLAAELKMAADMELDYVHAQEVKAMGKPDDDELFEDPAEEALETPEEEAAEEADETDEKALLAKLDGFEKLADNLTTEEVYEKAISEDVNWLPTATGELEQNDDEPAGAPEIEPDADELFAPVSEPADDDAAVAAQVDALLSGAVDPASDDWGAVPGEKKDVDDGWGALPADAN